jgi:hypothetical protein
LKLTEVLNFKLGMVSFSIRVGAECIEFSIVS